MKQKKRSLYKQILMMLFIAILVPLVLITGINYCIMEKEQKEDFEQMANSGIKTIAQYMQYLSDSSKESVNMLSLEPNAKLILENSEYEQWLNNSLKSFLESHNGVTAVYMGTKTGKVIAQPEQNLSADFDVTKTQWYQKAVQNPNEVILTDPYISSGKDKKYEVTYAKAVKDASGNIVGVIGLDIKLEYIDKITKNVRMGRNGFIMIMDKNGTILSNKDGSAIGEKDKKIFDIINSKGQVFEQDISGTKMVLFKNVDKNNGYIIVGLIPKKELVETIVDSVIMSVIIAVLFISAAMWFAHRFTKKKIISPIRYVVNVLNDFSDGNFTKQIEMQSGLNIEMEHIVNAINITKDNMINIIQSIKDASYNLKENSSILLSITEQSSVASDEIAKAIQQIADGSVNQSEKLNESVKLTETLNDIVGKSLMNSEEMMKASEDVREISDEGRSLLRNLDSAFNESQEANLEVIRKVKILGDKSKEIEEITEVIKGITEQTKLLALNASIEAARAGEAGKGFSVVADEVTKLAEQSSNSAVKIKEVIDEVKSSIKEVFDKLDSSTKFSIKTGENINVTEENFSDIRKCIEILRENIDNVNVALKDIKSNKDSVSDNIGEVSAVAQETAATSQEVSASSEEQASGLQEIVSSAEKLNNLSKKLENIVHNFKI
ncbi:methyl-accepting chemotaxis protein [Clostridium botulinum C str. Eklund]|nr:methyl-accepting chemotaxis protein [Clostridium botulinum C str. Eklund]NEZ49417.1 methyl-accepting chemotaxis protein [Clostridium botulinum]